MRSRRGLARTVGPDLRLAYVVAVGLDFQITTRLGAYRAEQVFAKIKRFTRKAWTRCGCGQGAKGPRVYDWAMVATTSPNDALLIRRSITNV